MIGGTRLQVHRCSPIAGPSTDNEHILNVRVLWHASHLVLGLFFFFPLFVTSHESDCVICQRSLFISGYAFQFRQ